MSLRDYYMTEQSMVDDVRETHVLMPQRQKDGSTIYRLMILLPTHGDKKRWSVQAIYHRRETAEAAYSAEIRRVVHNRIVARASMSWAD